MEYCENGSLLSYLLKMKNSFINQLDPATDILDPSIETKINLTKNVLDFSTNINLEQHENRQDFTDTPNVNTMDLMTWAFQVAMGMEYLSSRKVLL